MIKHTLYAITLGFVIFFLYLLQYTGAFKSITLGIDDRGPYTMIYKEHKGAYHQIVSTIESVENWAHTNGLKCRLSFGEYFDDPRLVEEGRLTSRGGCLIETIEPTADIEQKNLSKIKNKMPADFKIEVYQKRKAVVALFTGAPGIGPMKVYPKAEKYIQEKNLKKLGSILEIYEVFAKNTMQTLYIWPVE